MCDIDSDTATSVPSSRIRAVSHGSTVRPASVSRSGRSSSWLRNGGTSAAAAMPTASSSV